MTEQGPTPSPLSNKIIKVCEEILAGSAPSEDLGVLINKTLKDLQTSWNEFQQKIIESGPDHYQTYQNEIEDINKSFAAYQAALQEISQYLEDKNPKHLEHGKEDLRYETFIMIKRLNTYQYMELAQGPTDIPYVNFLIRSANAMMEGKIKSSLFIGLIRQARSNAERAIRDITRQESGPEIDAAVDAYQYHLEAYQMLDEGVKKMDHVLISEALEHLTTAAVDLRDAFQRLNLKRLTELPTESPHINLLINIIKELISVQLPEEVFLDAVSNFELAVERMKREFQVYSSVPIDSVEIAEEIQRAKHAFALLDLALQDIHAFIEGRNLFLLERAVGRLEEAGNLLAKCYASFQEIANKEGKIPCIKCHHYNPVSRTKCENCGTPLPQITGPSAVSTFSIDEEGEPVTVTPGEMVMTENLKKLFDAANQVAEDQISMEEYLDVVSWLENMARQQLERTRRLPTLNPEEMPEEEAEVSGKLKEIMEETKATMLEGLEEFIGGLETMKEFAIDHDKEHLVEGIRQVWSGAAKIFNSEKIAGGLEEMRKEQRYK
ncbi:MAG: hypothetical protein J7M18_05350 [Candidatus Eremiobacteraeota bacterium]|nr:hypothetical protein [Candidatus Eremiobacteraeota bacterium]